MKKVDRIDYDLVSAFRERKKAQLEEELERIRGDRDAAKERD